jgi:cold shock CspA family protein
VSKHFKTPIPLDHIRECESGHDARRDQRANQVRTTGEVSAWNGLFGFLRSDDGAEHFVHRHQLGNISGLIPGQRVEYALGIGRDGRRSAQKLKILGE